MPFGLAEGTKVPRIALALVLKRKHPGKSHYKALPIISLLTLIGLATERLSAVVRTATCSTSPESLARSVHAIKPAEVTTIAVRIFIMDTDSVIPGRPTHVHLIFWGRVVLTCPADVVVSTSIAI